TLTERLAQRNVIARTLAHVDAHATLETAASAVCEELHRSGGGAAIVLFTGDGAVAVGVSGVSIWGLRAPGTLPTAVATYLHERAGRGPWLERAASILATV